MGSLLSDGGGDQGKWEEASGRGEEGVMWEEEIEVDDVGKREEGLKVLTLL